MLTGLSLLYGRAVLIPLLGHEGFSSYAMVAKTIHNYVGPLFMVGLVLMFFAWVRDNFPDPIDWQWLKEFGGMVGDRHPSACRFNAGEKIWFWLLMLVGSLVVVTGLVLDFPNFDQQREWLQVAHLIHATVALLLIAAALAHIYIGTLGTEGALEGMVTGRVDESWARQHHDLWYQEIRDSSKPSTGQDQAGTSATEIPPP